MPFVESSRLVGGSGVHPDDAVPDHVAVGSDTDDVLPRRDEHHGLDVYRADRTTLQDSLAGVTHMRPDLIGVLLGPARSRLMDRVRGSAFGDDLARAVDESSL